MNKTKLYNDTLLMKALEMVKEIKNWTLLRHVIAVINIRYQLKETLPGQIFGGICHNCCYSLE